MWVPSSVGGIMPLVQNTLSLSILAQLWYLLPSNKNGKLQFSHPKPMSKLKDRGAVVGVHTASKPVNVSSSLELNLRNIVFPLLMILQGLCVYPQCLELWSISTKLNSHSASSLRLNLRKVRFILWPSATGPRVQI